MPTLQSNGNPLGMYVKRCRQQRGWTLAELSHRSGVPYGTLRNIEQNKKPVKPQEGTIRALATALDERDPEMLFTLAGYGIPLSPTVEARKHSIDALLVSHPEWRKELQAVQDDMTPAQQDQALQVLRVFIRMTKGKG
jgi:transcriptional regulator with XRE-family HTH domain